MPKTLAVRIHDQEFILHPTGALFWEEQDLLLISDVHLGKVSHFRKHGSAVPQQAVAGNFKKLDEVVNFFQPRKIAFLGDLFHSALNKEWQLFEAWLENISAEVILIEGNHDIISPLKYEALGVKSLPEFLLGKFFLTHHPEKRAAFFNFSGHLHPGVKIHGRARQELKLPCFFQSEGQMILPAFGEFTGKYILDPREAEHVYLATSEEIIPLKK